MGFMCCRHQQRVGSYAVIGEDQKWMDWVDLFFFFMFVPAVKDTTTYKTKKNPQTIDFIFFSDLPLLLYYNVCSSIFHICSSLFAVDEGYYWWREADNAAI
jgi:hypothetical protein